MKKSLSLFNVSKFGHSKKTRPIPPGTANISVNVTLEFRELMRAAAKRQGRKVGQWVRWILENELAREQASTLRAAEDPTPYGEHSKSPAAAPPTTVPNGKTNVRKSA